VKHRPPEWTAVEPYLDQLLDMPENEREAYLSRLDADQPTIADSLRKMLAVHVELREKGFLEADVVGAGNEDLVGVQIGAYTINSLIGRGGMGEVWLALRSDGRFEGKFAIKFLDKYAASPLALDRFRREGRLLARLAHPHIARLIDAGVTPIGRPYLVLEYVEGEPIDGYCESRSLGVEARVRLLLDVLAALTHAHGNLVVHRDIKPSNVMVTAGGEAKLLDFGIAKLLSSDANSESEAAPTRIEDAPLTPEYAAPEQILGEPASTATDVYQFGVLMFVLLAGRLPLATKSITRAERVRAVLDSEPPRLSDVALTHWRKSLRGDLDAIVAKALRKLPQERYATAAAVADDLKRYLDDEPVAARDNLFSYRLRKFVARYRGAVIGTSAAVLALIAAAAFALLQMREAQVQRDQSREQARRAELQAEFMVLMMSTVGDKPTTAEKLLDAGVKLLEANYSDDPKFRAVALLNLSARYGDLGLDKKAYASLQKVDALARQLDDPTLIARADCGIAEAEMDAGHLDRAVARVSAANAALAHASDVNPLYREECMEAEAEMVATQGKSAAAIQIAEKALALLEAAGQTRDIRYPGLLGRIAGYYKNAGNTHQGYEYGERALEASRRNGLEDTDSTLTAEHNVASSLLGFGEVKEGCAREKDVITRLQTSGRAIITAMAVLYGICYLRQGDAAMALSWYDQGLSAAEREDEVALQMHARANRARALIALKRFAEAGEELDRVTVLAKQGAVGIVPGATRAKIVRAELLMAQGRDEDARRALSAVLIEVRDDKNGRGAFLASVLLWSAKVALAQARYADAANFAQEALAEDVQRARNPAASADVGEASLLLAKAKDALNDKDGMHAAAQQALVSLQASLGENNPLTRDALAMRR